MNFTGMVIEQLLNNKKIKGYGRCLGLLFVCMFFNVNLYGEDVIETRPYRIRVTVNSGLFERNDYVVSIPVKEILQKLKAKSIIAEINKDSLYIIEQAKNKIVPSTFRNDTLVFLMSGKTSTLSRREYIIFFDTDDTEKKYSPPIFPTEEIMLLNMPFPGENLLLNSGFEQEGTSPDIPKGWLIIRDNQMGIEASMKRTEEESHTGKYSLKWEVKGENKGIGVEARVEGHFIPLKPNTSYTISFYAKVIDVPKERWGPFLWLEFLNAEKKKVTEDPARWRIGAGPPQGATHQEWRKYTIEGTTPSETAYGFLRLFSWCGRGMAFIDDVELKENVASVPCEVILGELEVLK